MKLSPKSSPFWKGVILVLVIFITGAVFTNCSQNSNSPSGDSTPPPSGGPQPPYPALNSDVSDCTAVTQNPCSLLDLAQPQHTIPSDIFGEVVEWKDSGNGLLIPDPAGTSPGQLRSELVDALGGLGVTVLRYPGGILNDMFHWQQAVGARSSRQQQPTMYESGGQLVRQIPDFGPDEFAQFASRIGANILLQANVSTGTPQEAANWVTYWKSKGISIKYFEIGNENYLAGPLNYYPALTAANYAAKFDAFATAIRAVDPNIKIGLVGTIDTASWCYPNCAAPPPWNQVVLSTIQQKADFFSIHDAYAPNSNLGDAATYNAMLGYPQFMKFSNGLLAQDIQMFAKANSKNMPLAITEHASYFVGNPTELAQNQTLGAALFSALSYHVFLQDSHVGIANHNNVVHFVFQSPILISFPSQGSYAAPYVANPIVSAFGHVFKAYREVVGHKFVSVKTQSPQNFLEDTGPAFLAPAQKNVPLIDSVAALSSDASLETKSWIFFVNRSLDRDIDTSIVIKNIPAGATKLVIDQLTAVDYTSANIPVTNPTAVQFSAVQTYTLPRQAQVGFTVRIPKHSLYRLKIQ